MKGSTQNVKNEPAKGLASPPNLDRRPGAGVPTRVPEKPAPFVQKDKKEYVGVSVNSPTKKDFMKDSPRDGRPPWEISTRVAPKPVPYFNTVASKKQRK